MNTLGQVHLLLPGLVWYDGIVVSIYERSELLNT